MSLEAEANMEKLLNYGKTILGLNDKREVSKSTRPKKPPTKEEGTEEINNTNFGTMLGPCFDYVEARFGIAVLPGY